MEENENETAERGVADPPNDMMGSPEATSPLPQNDPNAVPDPLPEDAGSVSMTDVGQGASPEDPGPPM